VSTASRPAAAQPRSSTALADPPASLSKGGMLVSTARFGGARRVDRRLAQNQLEPRPVGVEAVEAANRRREATVAVPPP
jgi:hypothetical protein